MACEESCTAIRTLGGMWVITVVEVAARVWTAALVTNSANTKTKSTTLSQPHPCNPLWRMLRPAAIVDGTVTRMSKVSSLISAATNGVAVVHKSDGAPTLPYPAPSRPNRNRANSQPVARATMCFDLGGSVATRDKLVRHSRPRWRPVGPRTGDTMIDDLAYEGVARETPFAVYAERHGSSISRANSTCVLPRH